MVRPVRPREGELAIPVKERVVLHIRGLIQKGRLRPGDRLPTERELAVQLGVSRPSVRSALNALSAMGVVRSRQGAGTFMKHGPPILESEPLSLLAALHDFTSEEMFEARAALEVVAAALAAQRATAEQRARMAEEVAGMFASIEDEEQFLLHDVSFHRAVAAGSNNPVLAALVDMVSVLVYDRRRVTIKGAKDLRETARIHQRIYQTIAHHDATGARTAMAEHLRLALEGWSAQGGETAAKTPPPRRSPRAPGKTA
jgi:GntR family transcriptional regulator, transcriptional repressor for pyruvate dehydrogenase complex